MAIADLLSSHHKHCDEVFARAEEACADGAWSTAESAFAQLVEELGAHFAAEEELLFPAFEEATGMRSGPTAIMRGEHAQMRELLEQMRAALPARDEDAFGGTAETLLILMQQHNMKEENILYPMCEQAVGGGELDAALAERLRRT